ncbi:MAG: hypothetical protein PHH28_11965 [Desulfuromonadaceae bacterium]|nr:hypothetical protein [Desulfuromonadaceae bacterium]
MTVPYTTLNLSWWETLSGSTRRTSGVVVTAVILLHTAAGFSFACEKTTTKSPPSAEAAPWPGPIPWEETKPWLVPVPWSEPAPWWSPNPPTNYFDTIEKTVVETHSMLEQNILRQTIRFDNFFGTVKPENNRTTQYNIRWRNSLRIGHGGTFNLGSSLQANFALTKISERLHLFITGENDPGLTTRSLPEDPGNPGFDRTSPTAHFANTELRYELIQKPSLNLFVGTGVRLALPFEVFARSRVQYRKKLGELALMRVGETFFVKNTDYFGETTEVSLERLLNEGTLLHWAGVATASKEINGLEWGSELSLTRQLSSKAALTFKGGIYGNTTASSQIQNYLLLARYRRNFLKPWLYYELEPQLSWPSDPIGIQHTRFDVTFRLEIVFQGTTANEKRPRGIK